MAGGFFGVSVEEALTRSGILDGIIKHFQNMSQEEWRKIQIMGNNLDKELLILHDLKEQFNAANNLLKKFSATSSGNNTDGTRQKGSLEATQKFNLIKKQLQPQLIKVFTMEHELLDTLTDGATTTADYAIYYYGEASGGKHIMSSRIVASDLYASDYLQVNNQGNLMLSQQVTQAKELLKDTEDLSQNEQALKDLDELVKTMMAFFRELSSEYNKIKAEATKKHLGYEKDRIHDVLLEMQKNNEIKETFNERVNRMREFLFAGGKIGLGGRINRGHIVEAYRHLQQARQNGDSISYYKALQLALNDDPWYIGGDVGSTQVKAFFDKNDRQIATYSSIVSLGHKLVNMIKNVAKTTFDKIRQLGEQRIKGKDAMAWRQSDKELQALLEKEIDELMKILDK